MELCEGGELFDRLRFDKKRMIHMSEMKTAVILAEVLQGLKHIHDQNIGHFDLKPENIVFATKDKNSTLKIIDFGMARPVPPHVYLQNFAGTPYYTAPEIINSKYNNSADMWSMGVIMFLMLYGFPPFHATAHKEGAASTTEVLKKVIRGFKPVVKKGYGAFFPEDIKVSSYARDLMAKLLTRDTSKRLTVDEMIVHPWFSKAQGISNTVDPRVSSSLLQFHVSNKFHNMVLHALATHLSPSDEEVVYEAFSGMDENHDGYITIDELEKALGQIKNEKAARPIRDIFDQMDENGDGKLSLHELHLAYLQKKVLAKEERLWEAFTHLDASGTMYLNLKDLKTVLLDKKLKHINVSEKEIESAFHDADCDKDKLIDYDEFLLMMGSKRVPPRAGTMPYHIHQKSQELKAVANSKDLEKSSEGIHAAIKK
eukprot:CAMPEP_0167750788 /NCGR_PEP_ID=MMETSP0110_2-20121227/6188_1 /TAXON_ID=629695 /ORGANISM="Gymnochlora sp., Strain CCMP2014" /LENGTH=426 /DNA_ID=CAMNT_0007636153 /DNA_START=426 /DNA_END=1706 /DNA_ORIENTATION=-